MQPVKKILIVEDEDALLRPLLSLFRQAGWRTEGAKDGEQGLIKLAKFKPDVMLLDIICLN